MDALADALDDLKRRGIRPKYIYTIPTVQNPTGTILSEPRRVEMLKLVGLLAGKLEKSVVLSSHILQDVEEVCSHVVLLEKLRAAAP